MFKDFPLSLLAKMKNEELALHSHTWTVASQTYIDRPNLQKFFKILAVDKHNDTEFVMAVEAKNYPIFGVMNHPETQNLRAFGNTTKLAKGRVNTETTDAI